MQQATLQPAYLLHSRPYRETSLIIEAFTPEVGRVSLVAKGVRRKKSPLQPLLQLFRPLLISWRGKGSLQNLTDVEPHGAMYQLGGMRLMSGFYINELLIRLIACHDPHPVLFAAYEQLLARLSESSLEKGGIESALRYYEVLLLDELGYGLALECDSETGELLEDEVQYQYLQDIGPVRWRGGEASGVVIHGATLKSLASGDLGDERVLKEAKRLMRVLLGIYLGDKPLNSRVLMRQMSG